MIGRLSRHQGLAIACAVLASCGGGGGGGSDAEESSLLTFDPAALEIVQRVGVWEEIEVSATIDPVPEGRFIAVIQADKPVVKTGEVDFDVLDDDTAVVMLRTDRTLPVGTHKGRLTVRLCRDVQCKDEIKLRGNVLSYSIEVLPRLEIVASAGVDNVFADGTHLIASGARVVLESNVPVTWDTGIRMEGTRLEVISTTPRRWEGRVFGHPSAFIEVTATPVADPEGVERVHFEFV